MEYKLVEDLNDKSEGIRANEVAESNRSKFDEKYTSKLVPSPPGNNIPGGENVAQGESPIDGISGEVNMEASITTDDVIRAGGFGARDDIGSLLPVASDSTDFEATIREARDYEEPQGEICRPGLGWTEVTETK